MRAFMLTLALWGMAAGAVAQSENPVRDHYRAFIVAHERGDLRTAEAAATAALAASEARDGAGGSTAVLALNLATTRLQLGRAEAAVQPADRAFSIATTNPSAGVDPLMAELVLARAEISSSTGDSRSAEGGAARLRRLLPLAEARPELVGETYPAAVALAVWAFSVERFEEAESAWQTAYRFAEGANGDPTLARAYAQIGVAAALTMRSAGEEMEEVDRQRAAQALGEALSVYRSRVRAFNDDGSLTDTQRAYAQALAWRAALAAKLRSDGVEAPETLRGFSGMAEIGSPSDSRPACSYSRIDTPRLRYPSTMGMQGAVGSVIVHLRTNEEGEIVYREVAAAVGAPFTIPIEGGAEWRVEWVDNGLCRKQASWFATVMFVIAAR